MIDLPIGRQTFDFDCRAKALQIVIAYYGIDIREDELMKALLSGQGSWLALRKGAFSAVSRLFLDRIDLFNVLWIS